MATKKLQAKLRSVDELFAEDTTSYEIPIYQRNYAWGVEQIEQLIDDVWTAAQAAPSDGEADYFLGNLIVAEQDPKQNSRQASEQVIHEVIDGQQRLTTLYMLLTFLGVKPKAKLTYASRRTATEALAGLTTSENEEGSGIHTGYKAIEARMGQFEGFEVRRFVAFLLEQVKLVRAVLPRETDLNKYFEIMNTRGQQLRQVDIVKAQLMSYLRSDEGVAIRDQACFAWVWDACADMDSYVQMSLTPRRPDIREQVFGDTWDRLKVTAFADLARLRPNAEGFAADFRGHGVRSLRDALSSYALAAEPPLPDDPENTRFTSPIEFPSLLLHTLKVMRGSQGEDLDDRSGQLDDNRLIKLFVAEFQRFPDGRGRSERAKQFVETLLRCKFILDNCILKREFTATNGDDGAWSLKRLARGEPARGRKTRVSARFPNAFAPSNDDWDDVPLDDSTRNLLLLQSMLRVTYTSPRTMHWITTVLRLPVLDMPRHDAAALIESTLRDYARRKVKQAFFDVEVPMGFNIERVVFTYLDYLLARELDPKFVFTYRNSIEHFYPQYPEREQLAKWPIESRLTEDAVELDLFGNLALVSVGANSKFSNSMPNFKVGFGQTIQQSWKLVLMARKAESAKWDSAAIRVHHQEMVERLRADLMAGGLSA